MKKPCTKVRGFLLLPTISPVSSSRLRREGRHAKSVTTPTLEKALKINISEPFFICEAYLFDCWLKHG